MIDGATLRELRQRTGRTQRDVARAAGIPAPVLSAYERGRRSPSVESASHIVDVLGYRVRFVPGPDPAVQGHRLAEALLLAEALPYRPRPMARARR